MKDKINEANNELKPAPTLSGKVSVIHGVLNLKLRTKITRVTRDTVYIKTDTQIWGKVKWSVWYSLLHNNTFSK